MMAFDDRQLHHVSQVYGTTVGRLTWSLVVTNPVQLFQRKSSSWQNDLHHQSHDRSHLNNTQSDKRRITTLEPYVNYRLHFNTENAKVRSVKN